MIETKEDKGNFLVGLTLGLFAGAAGYFLFGTENGKKIQQKLSQEWAEAKKELEARGQLKKDTNLKQLVNSIFDNICPNKKLNNPPKKEIKKSALHLFQKKKSPQKFKGV